MSATNTPSDSISYEIRLASRPAGEPSLENFELAKSAVPSPGDGQVLVRNTWMSVDPYMRGRMNPGESYIPPFEIGSPLEGSAVGEVVASRSPDVPVGSTVTHFAGWRSHAVVDAATVVVVDTAVARPQDYLGALGTTGLTAYAALTDVTPVRDGDVVFVSAAAGAVGSVAGQLARQFGASTVIGSAGGAEKAERLVKDFGFDVAIDYQASSVAAQLADAAPGGIDLYVDNVGGDHLEAAIGALRVGGRIAGIGMISGYNATTPVPAPKNLFQVYGKRLTIRGMLVSDYFHLFPEYVAKAAGWLADGSLRTSETVMEGLDQAPAALLGVLNGANTGKMLVRL
ncbi:NADP-dependent oxidoreductase [Phytoactinopolyspora alkaliphila]|uniref:NADP-dependent oxidoreductase n=1 Tax=Phytoactinopolyspora alkaliphila TaxID=1783498 RepID=A0A6N9YP43_9ACTN|nr:NADP-dependent oxidoreductase [Phytoactinopolyspora alkaliphila]NED96618.1 NADP-dependent oxidoreductase [Phytoactinopolyspora alkaliphila]